MFQRSEIFEPATTAEKIANSPIRYLITIVYELSVFIRGKPTTPKDAIRVVCISDTHCKITDDIPDGDLLIHAGDLANEGDTKEIQAQIDWLSEFPHRHKIVIAGNHDTFLDSKSRMTLSEAQRQDSLDWKGIKYLQHDTTELSFPNRRTLKVYGAPQIPQCGGKNFAFQYPRGQDAWSDTIPTDVDILVTHTPPKYHLDNTLPNLGCEHLLHECWKVRPKLHAFGHVHVGAGQRTVYWDDAQRAYERAMARSSSGLIGEVLNPWLWIDLAEVVVHGFMGIIWSRVWGGGEQITTLVNSALVYNNTGKIGRSPQVVEI